MDDDRNERMMRLALLTTSQMAAADSAAIASGSTGIALMERAGLAVAEAAMRIARRRGGPLVVAVICGPGKNGGDGLVAARLLREQGISAHVCLLGEPGALPADAAEALRRWNGPLATLDDAMACAPACIVDALFGAGLARPLGGLAAGAACRMNDSGVPVVSVDVPSGLDGNTGRAEGPMVRPAETVTFFRRKPGHVLMPGRELCGTVTVADIGIPDRVLDGIRPLAFANEPALWRTAWPHHGREAHKYSRGAVAVIAGGVAGVGAPRLAARAALRIGAGLVTVHCAPAALVVHAARGPDALMQRALRDAEGLEAVLADERLKAVLAGPALGTDERARALIARLARHSRPVVFDADALTLLAASPAFPRGPGGGETERGGPGGEGLTVLTPHEGEFRRLFGGQPAVMERTSKLEKARAAAALCGAVVVYKGADTVIAAPDGRAAVNATGSVALATAGSGDVLGGMIAGLLTQGMPAFEAAAAAVWLHGRVGERLGFGLLADDLADHIPQAARDAGLGEAPRP